VPRCRICYRSEAPRCWAACLAIERVQSAVGSACETALTFAHDDGKIRMFLTQTAVGLQAHAKTFAALVRDLLFADDSVR